MIQLSLSLTGHLNQIHKCTDHIFFLGGGVEGGGGGDSFGQLPSL